MMSQLLRYAPVLDILRAKRPRLVLEVGSGSQGLGKFVAWRFIGADLTFSDYTGAERRSSAWMSPVRTFAAALPFRAETFDLVVLMDVLEHIPPEARSAVVDEARRVTRGTLVIGFPSGRHAETHDRQLAEWLRWRSRPASAALDEHLQHPFPVAEQVEAALRSPFTGVRIVLNAWLPLHRFWMRWEATPALTPYSALLSDLLAPTRWNWRTHRYATNLLRLLVRPAWRLLKFTDRAPAYRTLVIAEPTACARPCDRRAC